MAHADDSVARAVSALEYPLEQIRFSVLDEAAK